jgi:hypothetical protein
LKVRRLFFFLVSIAAGVGLGLLYGWGINPPADRDLPATELRSDYKTDFVLMVAEVYESDSDLQAARARLSLIGDPQQAAQDAILIAQQNGYAFNDVETLAHLLQGFQAGTTLPAGGLP